MRKKKKQISSYKQGYLFDSYCEMFQRFDFFVYRSSFYFKSDHSLTLSKMQIFVKNNKENA